MGLRAHEIPGHGQIVVPTPRERWRTSGSCFFPPTCFPRIFHVLQPHRGPRPKNVVLGFSHDFSTLLPRVKVTGRGVSRATKTGTKRGHRVFIPHL